MERKFGVSRCKLLYIGWISNKILLYSTGNYIQYPVINHMENIVFKETRIIWLLLFSPIPSESRRSLGERRTAPRLFHYPTMCQDIWTPTSTRGHLLVLES